MGIILTELILFTISDLNNERRRHQDFRDKVRDRIVQAVDDGEICEAGYDALDELGLERPKKNWHGNIIVTLSYDNLMAVPENRYGVSEPDQLTIDSFVDELSDALDFLNRSIALPSGTTLCMEDWNIDNWETDD